MSDFLSDFLYDRYNTFRYNYKNNELLDVLCYNNVNLYSIKHELNQAKSGLDKFNINSKEFEKKIRLFDFYSNLKFKLVKIFNAQFVSNAWLKCYEILENYNIMEKTDFRSTHTYNIFFNAELPGSFISSCNHYCKTNNIKYNYLASSYIDFTHNNKTLGDDYGLMKKYPNKWIIDKNMNGDLTKLENIIEINKRVKNIMPVVDIYFSDAGIDVNHNYSNQEELHSLLNFGQILCGLNMLSDNGTMVIKQYTFCCPMNIGIMIYLNSIFKDVSIVKPKTSRPTNSEIYIICKGLNKSKLQLEKLYASFNMYIDMNNKKLHFYDYSIVDYNMNNIGDIYEISKMLFIYYQKKLIEKIITFLSLNIFINVHITKVFKEDEFITCNKIKIIKQDQLL